MCHRIKTMWLCLSVSVIASMAALAQSGDTGTAPGKTEPEYDIRYINDKAPAASVPALQGEFYDDFIPDTLDIAERSLLAVNGLTGPLDPACDYELYWVTKLIHNPPVMYHDWNDWCGYKFWESLPLMRMVTGSNLNDEVDRVWLQVLMKSIGPDGLFYIPMEGRPWSKINTAWGPTVWRADGTTTHIDDPTVHQISNPFPTGRVLSQVIIYWHQSGDPMWKKIAEGMIDRSLELMVDKGDYGYIPTGYFEPNAKVSPDAEQPAPLTGLESYARLIQAPAQFYRLSGYEPAKKLSLKMINNVRYHGIHFDADGKFIGREFKGERMLEDLERRNGEHFHAHTYALLSMLDYGLATGDQELLSFVKKSFEWARAECGHPTVGFFWEWVKPDYPTSESCGVADMVAIALKLSRGGVGDFWDDADRWIRNQFAGNQLTRIDWVSAATADLPHKKIELRDVLWEPEKWKGDSTVPPGMICDVRVPERILGGFAGWPTANDWSGDRHHHANGIMHCCTGNATRTLYYIYENILEEKDKELKVHLLLNRAARSADLYSYIPYEGKMKIKVKQPLEHVLVRMPSWVETDSKTVVCAVDQQKRPHTWQGRYIDLGAVQPGSHVTVSFPMVERTSKEKLGGVDYTLKIRGHNVMSTDPPGKLSPLYQDNKGQMSWRPTRRFVCDKLFEY